MISYEQFVKMFKDTDTFEKAFPAGFKFKWIDRDTWHIVGYLNDEYKTKDNPDFFIPLVVIKSWSKYKQRWTYDVQTIFCFFSTWEFIGREVGFVQKTKEYKNICKEHGYKK